MLFPSTQSNEKIFPPIGWRSLSTHFLHSIAACLVTGLPLFPTAAEWGIPNLLKTVLLRSTFESTGCHLNAR